MNKFFLFPLVVSLSFLSCSPKAEESSMAEASEAGRQLMIGFSSYTQRGPYFSAAAQAIKKTVEAKGWKLISTDAENKAEKQIADVEDMLARGIDYLILNPKDGDSGIRIVRSAQKKDVPVITIDSGIGDEAPVVTRILSPNFDSNEEIGKYLASKFRNSKLSIGMIDGEKGNIVTMARRNGFILGIINWQLDNLSGTDFKINTLLYTAWDAEGGVRGTEDLLSAFPDLNVIYVTTDDMARGAIRHLKSTGRLEDVAVVGFDGSNEGINLVEKGEYFATALNSPGLMVSKAFDVIDAYENGQRVFPSNISYEPVLITEGNASKHKGAGF